VADRKKLEDAVRHVLAEQDRIRAERNLLDAEWRKLDIAYGRNTSEWYSLGVAKDCATAALKEYDFTLPCEVPRD